MGWSIWNLFHTPDDLFKRPEENRLMLEQYLAVLEASYVVLSGTVAAQDQRALDEVGKVIERYRAYRLAKAAGEPAPLPEWNEAFLAEQLLNRLLPPDEARAQLVTQLAALKAVDAAAHAELSAEWNDIKDNADVAATRAPGLLVSALRATQWKNTQRWIIRTLGTQYAVRLRGAFLFALTCGVLLVVADAVLGQFMRRAALSGLGFAAAAGLLGASFSAMVGQGRVFELDNIEEARAVTSKQMIALRLGVGVAAATIVYFFFESGLVDGALFPDLEQIGFGRVIPLGTELDELRANAQALDRSASALVETMRQATERIGSVVASMPPTDPLSHKAAEVQMTALGTAAGATDNVASDLVVSQLKDKLQVTAGEIGKVSGQIGALQEEWAKGGRALGSLAPNADLSKLVVWCFAAGFTQTLVPSMLAKVAPPAKSGP